MFLPFKLLGRVVPVTLLLMFLTAPSALASDDFLQSEDAYLLDDCGQFWPSVGEFETVADGDIYTATLRFRLSESEVASLSCVDSNLELDFRIFGFDVPVGWDGYSLSTNLPGSVHGTGEDGGAGVAMPRIAGIDVSRLVVGRDYYATVAFNSLNLNGDGQPRVSFEWVPSHWVSVDSDDSCYAGRTYDDEALCVSEATRVYLSQGYFGELLVFDGDHVWQFLPS